MTSTALIVIDVQNGLLAKPELVHDADGVLGRIAALVARARAANTPIIFVQHDGGAGHSLEKPLSGWHIHVGTGFRDDDVVVEKRDCDAFHATDLQSRLDALHVRHLIIAGMCSDYCVDTTCRRAYSLGYEVTLASDAHTTFSRARLSAAVVVEHHNAILGSAFAKTELAADIIFQSYGQIVSLTM